MKKKIKKGEVTVFAKYVFSPEEKARIADEMAETIDEKSATEDELSTIKAQFKSKLEKNTADINKLSRQYKDGYEHRYMKAILTLNFETEEREYADPETGEILKKEPLYEADYQRELKEIEGKNDKRKK